MRGHAAREKMLYGKKIMLNFISIRVSCMYSLFCEENHFVCFLIINKLNVFSIPHSCYATGTVFFQKKLKILIFKIKKFKKSRNFFKKVKKVSGEAGKKFHCFCWLSCSGESCLRQKLSMKFMILKLNNEWVEGIYVASLSLLLRHIHLHHVIINLN